jgi:hypothetical protein
MKALSVFEMSVATYQTTRRNIGQDLNRQQHRCENLKSRISLISLHSHIMQLINK